jgi:hypothetical protein
VTEHAPNRRTNPYVFFVGCPRSGTTLVRRIADAHPDLAVIGEQHWLPRCWERRNGIESDGTVKPALAEFVVADRRFRKIDVAPERVRALCTERKPYASFVSELFDLHGAAQGKLLVGEKTPAYVRSIPTLHELWPDARIVHLIRDGRDVALSLLSWNRAERILGRLPTWAEDRLTTAALFWEWNVRQGRHAGADLGTLYYEMRYERLVGDPAGACRELCEFLSLAYDPSMLRFHEGRTRGGESAKSAWLPVTPGLRDWRAQMAGDERRRFEAAVGQLLDELGYERTDPPSDEELRRAARLHEAFVEGVPAHWRAVPADSNVVA